MVVAACLSLALYTFTAFSKWSLKAVWNVDFAVTENSLGKYSEMYVAFGAYLALSGYIGISYCRYWLLYYMIKTSAALTDSKWRNIVNPRDDEHDWYLRHRNSCGSWHCIR